VETITSSTSHNKEKHKGNNNKKTVPISNKLAIPVTGRDTDGGEIVSLRRRPPFTPRKIPDTHFC
jgi:hypothetical protein